MSVIFEGTDMPKACCTVDGEHSSFAHFEYCKFYNICKQRETIKTNFRPGDCPVKPMDKELITKNDLGVDCISRAEVLKIFDEWFATCDIADKKDSPKIKIKALPPVTPQLSVPEVTALAEWTEKLTKECEEAYNKGYADGMKAHAENEGWIDPNTHCPPIGQDVLVKLNGGSIEIARLTKSGDWKEPGCLSRYDFCLVKSWKLLC